MLEEKNKKQVRMSTGGLLKKREMLVYKKEKQVHTYADVVSTGNINNER